MIFTDLGDPVGIIRGTAACGVLAVGELACGIIRFSNVGDAVGGLKEVIKITCCMVASYCHCSDLLAPVDWIGWTPVKWYI